MFSRVCPGLILGHIYLLLNLGFPDPWPSCARQLLSITKVHIDHMPTLAGSGSWTVFTLESHLLGVRGCVYLVCLVGMLLAHGLGVRDLQ